MKVLSATWESLHTFLHKKKSGKSMYVSTCIIHLLQIPMVLSFLADSIEVLDGCLIHLHVKYKYTHIFDIDFIELMEDFSPSDLLDTRRISLLFSWHRAQRSVVGFMTVRLGQYLIQIKRTEDSRATSH